MTKALMSEPTSSPSESIHGVDPRDHVATALRDLVAGETLDLHGQAIVARADIPKGHKIAVRAAGQGRATC
jgi:altronate hydrolase